MSDHESSPPRPEPATLNKIPFIVADIALIAASLILPLAAAKPLSVWVVAVCLSGLFAGFILLVTPFILEYTLRLRAQAQNQALEISAYRGMMEQVAKRSDAGHEAIKKVFDATSLNLAAYEGIAHRLQAKIDPLAHNLEQLKALNDGFVAGLERLSKQAESLREQDRISLASQLSAHRDAVIGILEKWGEPTYKPTPPESPTPPPNPVPKMRSDTRDTPKKPMLERALGTQQHAAHPIIPHQTPPPGKTPETPQHVATRPSSPPEATDDTAQPITLTAHILIGIGDRLCVRSNAPGMDLQVGQDMEFIAVGCYRWTHEACTDPVTLELYLNDEIPALDGPITLQPGDDGDITPDFP